MKTKLKITVEDYLKANKIGSRLADLEDSCGFKSLKKIFKNKKKYNRKTKHKEEINM